MKTLIFCLGLLAAGVHPTRGADLFYKKALTLYVLHAIHQGASDSRQLDTAVGKYAADAGAVVYLKGSTLYLIRNTHHPEPVILDRVVLDFEFRDGVIAYIRDACLYVRRVAESEHDPARYVLDSRSASAIDVADGEVVFSKGPGTLYRVSDIDRGTSERVIYPVSMAQLSSGK